MNRIYILLFYLLLSNIVLSQNDLMGVNKYKFLYYQLLSKSNNSFENLFNKINSKNFTIDSNIIVYCSKKIDSISIYDSIIVKIEQKKNKLKVYEFYEISRELEFVYNSRKKLQYINLTFNNSNYVLNVKNHTMLDINSNKSTNISDEIEKEYLKLFQRYYQRRVR